MAEMTLEFGTRLDIASGAEVQSVHDKLDGLFNRPKPKPLVFPLNDSGWGNGVLNLGRPPAGRMWAVTLLALLGSDDATTVAGKAALYVDSDASNLPLSLCRAPGLAIPSVTTFSRGCCWTTSNGDLCVNFTGVTGSAQVVANAVVEEWNTDDIIGIGR